MAASPGLLDQEGCFVIGLHSARRSWGTDSGIRGFSMRMGSAWFVDPDFLTSPDSSLDDSVLVGVFHARKPSIGESSRAYETRDAPNRSCASTTISSSLS